MDNADLDRFDRAILREVASDGRISVTDLAKRIGLSKSPTQTRLRRLEEDGAILGYRFRPGTVMHEDARRASRDLRRRLLHEGYGPFLESLARGLATRPEVDAFDRRRFARLVELGLAWDERAGLRPAEFAAMVRE